jgi:uncharacterized protein YaeQ
MKKPYKNRVRVFAALFTSASVYVANDPAEKQKRVAIMLLRFAVLRSRLPTQETTRFSIMQVFCKIV